MKKYLISGIFFLALIFVGCKKPVMESQTQYVFGTVCTINLFEDGSEDLYGEIFARLNEIDNKFNVNKENSEISIVNKNAGNGVAVNVSQEVFDVMLQAIEFSRLTKNCFNPALGSLIKLWGIGTDSQRVPSDDEIAEALQHCNPDCIKMICSDGKKIEGGENSPEDNNGEFYQIEITDFKTQIDLGGIVKGYAADCVVEILRKHNVSKAIIDLGGNIYVFGNKSKSDSDALWKVGIKNPVDPNSPPVQIVELKEGSVVTSGNYERFFEVGGNRYHHILDSRTGRPAESGLASVSVIYGKSIVCDALTTACFVNGDNRDFDPYDLGFEEIQFVFVDFSGKPVIK